MSNNQRILNQSRGFSLKHKQAVRAVENCAAAWVVFGESIRDCTLTESIALRNEQARMREPLPFAELPGCIYRPAPGHERVERAARLTAMEANQFARMAVA